MSDKQLTVFLNDLPDRHRLLFKQVLSYENKFLIYPIRTTDYYEYKKSYLYVDDSLFAREFPMFFHFSFPTYNFDVWYRIDDINGIYDTQNVSCFVTFGIYTAEPAEGVMLKFLDWNRKNTFEVTIGKNGGFLVNNETVSRVTFKNDNIDIECSNLILRVKEKTKQN